MTRHHGRVGLVSCAAGFAIACRDGSAYTSIPEIASDAGVEASPDTSDAVPDSGASWGCIHTVADKVLSSNASAIKSYQTNVNVASFRQQGVLFFAPYQYASWYDGSSRGAVVARRTLDTSTLAGGDWQWAHLNFQLIAAGDAHDVIAMGISPSDGRLHVAIGQHGAPLFYIRSIANAVSESAWDDTIFEPSDTVPAATATPAEGLPGVDPSNTSVATYPYFMNARDPDGTLQLAFRAGAAGNGTMQLAEYSAGSGSWTYIGSFTSATGRYTSDGNTSDTRNAYPHGFNYDETGRLHMAFTWREGAPTLPNCAALTNHDTMYVFSDDRGKTWNNSAGAAAGTTGSRPVGIDAPGILVDSLPIGRDLMNQETQITDHQNRFHAIISYVPERYQRTCATDRGQAQPFHLWRAPNGVWTKTEIKLQGEDVNQGYNRSKVFVDAQDNVYVVLPDLRMVGASAATTWTDWRLLYDGRKLGNYGETIIDYNLTRAAQGVSILYLKDTSAPTGELHLLDLRLYE